MASSIKLQNVSVIGIDKINRASSLRNAFLHKQNIKSDQVPILNNINFEAKTGDRIGILGLNGSGKTSMLRTILKAYPHSSGIVEVNGKVLSCLDAGAGISDMLSGRDNIKLIFLYNNNITEYTKELEEQIIEFSDIDKNKIDTAIGQYSSGMIARLIFSATIFQTGNILLMDEVFATGDQNFIDKSYNKLQQLWQKVDIGITVSHSVSDIQALCTTCIIMSKGQIIEQGKTEEMINLYKKLS